MTPLSDELDKAREWFGSMDLKTLAALQECLCRDDPKEALSEIRQRFGKPALDAVTRLANLKLMELADEVVKAG